MNMKNLIFLIINYISYDYFYTEENDFKFSHYTVIRYSDDFVAEKMVK